jgi:predicted lipid-binding transport protein (Tim44 family)
MPVSDSKKLAVTAMVMMIFFFIAGIAELAEARSRSGGRSFGRSAQPSAPIRQPPPSQSSIPPNSPSAFSSPFARGVAGGLLGGMLGGMLFGGGTAHGMGMGGLGGSGIGLIEILLLAGLCFFLYKKFFRRPAFPPNMGTAPVFARSGPEAPGGAGAGNDPDAPPDRALVDGVKQIWSVDSDFDPDGFKETAQDLFFKIQAGWTRRETAGLIDLVGQQLLDEYAGHFARMKDQGQINRLENIAVRRVDLVQAGVAHGEIFVTVRFTANLLDVTVDESTGAVISGDPQNPVKFEELWTFARPVGTSHWKLEGIEG